MSSHFFIQNKKQLKSKEKKSVDAHIKLVGITCSGFRCQYHGLLYRNFMAKLMQNQKETESSCNAND